MIWLKLAAAAVKDALTLLAWPAQAIGRALEDNGDEA